MSLQLLSGCQGLHAGARARRLDGDAGLAAALSGIPKMDKTMRYMNTGHKAVSAVQTKDVIGDLGWHISGDEW